MHDIGVFGYGKQGAKGVRQPRVPAERWTSQSYVAKLQLQLQTPMGYVRRARGAIRTSSAVQ